MAVSVKDGIARPRLYEVGTTPGPGIEIHEIDVERLAANLNAIRANTIPEFGEATALLRMLAHAREDGRLAGLAEAGVA